MWGKPELRKRYWEVSRVDWVSKFAKLLFWEGEEEGQ